MTFTSGRGLHVCRETIVKYFQFLLTFTTAGYQALQPDTNTPSRDSPLHIHPLFDAITWHASKLTPSLRVDLLIHTCYLYSRTMTESKLLPNPLRRLPIPTFSPPSVDSWKNSVLKSGCYYHSMTSSIAPGYLHLRVAACIHKMANNLFSNFKKSCKLTSLLRFKCKQVQHESPFQLRDIHHEIATFGHN